MRDNSLSSILLGAGIFLILFFPLIVTTSLFSPFVLGKNLFFRLAVGLLFLVWVVLNLRGKTSVSGISTPIFYTFSVFLFIVFLSDVFGVDPSQSFLSSFERMEGFITYLLLFVLFILAASFLSDRRQWTKIMLTSIGVSAYTSLSELLKALLGDGSARLEGSFGSPIYLATYLLFHIFFLIFLSSDLILNRTPKWKFKISFAALLLIIELVALYKTATRGSLMALAVGLFASITIWLSLKQGGRRRLIIVGLAATTLVLALVLTIPFIRKAELINSPTLSRFQQLFQEDLSNNPRLLVWKIAWQGIKDKPVLGWGQENFPIVFERHYDPRLSLQETWFDRSHNSYLDWVISSGILGGLSFIIFVFSPFYVLWRRKDGEYVFPLAQRAVFTGLLLAYTVNILFVFDTLAGLIPLIFLLAYLSAQTSSRTFGFIVNKLGRIAIISPIVLLTILSVVFHVRVAVASRVLLQAITPPEYAEVKGRNVFFENALKWAPMDKGRIRREISDFAISVRDSEQVSDSEKDRLYELGVNELTREVEKSPNILRNIISLGDLHRIYGDRQKAIFHFSRAKELSPNRKNIRKVLGDMYMSEDRFEEAAEEYKALYELELLFGNNLFYAYYIDSAADDYIKALELSGRTDKAREVAEKRQKR